MSVAPPLADDCPLRGAVEPETLFDPELSGRELLGDERVSSIPVPVVLAREVSPPEELADVESLPEVAPERAPVLPLALPVVLELVEPAPLPDDPEEPD